MYYSCIENKGADQLRSYCEADLRLCFRIGKIRFSHDAAQMVISFREEYPFGTYKTYFGHMHTNNGMYWHTQ